MGFRRRRTCPRPHLLSVMRRASERLVEVLRAIGKSRCDAGVQEPKESATTLSAFLKAGNGKM